VLINLVIPDIHEIIENKDWTSLKKFLVDLAPADIAELLNDIDEKDAVILFRLLPRQLASDVFAELESSRQEFILTHIVNADIKRLMQDLSPDDRTDLFEELPGKLTQKILNLLLIDDRRNPLNY